MRNKINVKNYKVVTTNGTWTFNGRMVESTDTCLSFIREDSGSLMHIYRLHLILYFETEIKSAS